MGHGLAVRTQDFTVRGPLLWSTVLCLKPVQTRNPRRALQTIPVRDGFNADESSFADGSRSVFLLSDVGILELACPGVTPSVDDLQTP